MYCKNFRFAPLKTFWEFQADSEICSKSSNLYGLYITHGFCWIVLEFAKIFTNGQNLLTLIKNIDVIISKVSIYNMSYLSFNLRELWRLQYGWFGQNHSAKTSIWKGYNSYSLRNT